MMINRYKTAITTLFFLTLCFQSALMAQPNNREKMRRFQEERIIYFNEKLDLTEKESKEFWPLYEDLQHRIMKNMEDEKNLLNYYHINNEALSEKEVEKSITDYFNLRDQRHDLKMDYHNKFMAVIGKRKTMQMYALEREFKMHILQKFRSERGRRSGRGLRNNQ
ncbi:MAG TPA: hypothetical protein VJ951_04890 [Bacteroidales bacterium]|nr:hypothetical protein [Bacteroidales bacterium]